MHIRTRRGGQAGRASSIARRVTHVLRQEIVGCILSPGQRVSEQSLARRLGVSRAPVREATIQLEREGLLTRTETARLRVAAPDERDLAEILEARVLLEPEVVRVAAERHEPADIAALERNLTALAVARDVPQISLLDAEFHEGLAAATHQARLIQLWSLMQGQFLLWIATTQRRLASPTAEMRRMALAHHTEILDRVRDRDGEAASRYVRGILRLPLAIKERK